MKVLIPDGDPNWRDFLHEVLQRADAQVAWHAVEEEMSPKDIIARELRRILDGCPICDSGYRSHSYALLATAVMHEDEEPRKNLRRLFRFLEDHQWHDVLRFREWDANKDLAAVFVFRCSQGRIGILTVLSPVEEESDVPLHFAILSIEEGDKLQARIAAHHWVPLRAASRCR